MSKINICKYDKNSMRLYSKEIDIPELPDGAKNIVFFDGDDVYIRTEDDRGHSLYHVMPDIVDVSVIESGGEQKVVCVTFSDGKIMKAVLSSEDKFDLEQGISICLAKKFLDDKTLGNGSSVYNKIVRHGLKVFNRKNEAIEAERMAAAEAENRRRKYIEKRKRKMERKRQAELEAEIELRAEAYLRAMRKYNEINSTKDGSIDLHYWGHPC